MSGRAPPADPRGLPAGPRAAPAQRLAGGLAGRRLLILDNGKLDPAYGASAAIVDGLRSGVPDAEWGLQRHDLLRLGRPEIDPLADRIVAEQRPDAVVLALADAGVSVQTSLLAVALERRGVPTLVVATPLGAGAVRAILSAFLGPVPVVVLDTVRTDPRETVLALVEAALAHVTAALTRAPPEAPAAATAGPVEASEAWAAAAPAIAAYQDWAEAAGLGDGLPLLPPVPDAVARLLAMVEDDPDEVLYADALTSGRSLRVRDAAANAVMTACPPAAFPVVLAALRAVARPAFRLEQAAITSHPAGVAIVLSGGDPARFGLASGAGCLGPGHRGNAAVGRAVALAIRHLFGARPGEADLTTFGSPAEFTYCLAETATDSPWPPLAAERGDGGPSALVMKAEGPRNVIEHLAVTPADLARAIATAAISPGAINSFVPGDLLVLVNPEHARIFAQAGWSRADLAAAIHEQARLPADDLAGRGLAPMRPPELDGLDPMPVTRSPSDIHIVVAGAPGLHAMVALPWSYSRAQWQEIGPAPASPI